MPPKRRGTAPSASQQPQQKKKARLSKLARENGITGEEEAEIKEAFHLFSLRPEDDEEYVAEKEGVIKTQDVRRALIALGLSPSSPAELSSILSSIDPSQTGYVTYTALVSVCALKLHNRTEDAVSADVEHAYHLFTRGSDGPISLAHLQRVARDLKEDIGDELMRDMIREANGGGGVNTGVNVEQFRDVMRRAGVF